MCPNIQQAAMHIFNHSHRRIGAELSHKISCHVSDLVKNHFCAYFDSEYASVSGSTYRGTHLPNDFDFDIGIVPKDDTADYTDYEEPFKKLACVLSNRLASDQEICQLLADLYNVTCDDIRGAFQKADEKVWPKGIRLRTLKYKVKDHSIIELSVGTYPWHRLGLYYNSAWRKQMSELLDEERENAVSKICLLKLLAKSYNLYGHESGGPSSRGYEQMIIRHAQKQCPLGELMREMLTECEPRALKVLYPIRDKIWIDLGLNPASRNVMRAFSKLGWDRFHTLAKDILDWKMGLPNTCLGILRQEDGG